MTGYHYLPSLASCHDENKSRWRRCSGVERPPLVSRESGLVRMMAFLSTLELIKLNQPTSSPYGSSARPRTLGG